AEEVAVVRFGLLAAEAVGAGEERQDQPRPGRQAGPPHQEERKAGVGLEVDEVVEAAAVELGKHFADAGETGERPVERVDQGSEEHQTESAAKCVVAALDDQARHACGADESQAGEQVDRPGDSARAHASIISASYAFANLRASLTRAVRRETSGSRIIPAAAATVL